MQYVHTDTVIIMTTKQCGGTLLSFASVICNLEHTQYGQSNEKAHLLPFW